MKTNSIYSKHQLAPSETGLDTFVRGSATLNEDNVIDFLQWLDSGGVNLAKSTHCFSVMFCKRIVSSALSRTVKRRMAYWDSSDSMVDTEAHDAGSGKGERECYKKDIREIDGSKFCSVVSGEKKEHVYTDKCNKGDDKGDRGVLDRDEDEQPLYFDVLPRLAPAKTDCSTSHSSTDIKAEANLSFKGAQNDSLAAQNESLAARAHEVGKLSNIRARNSIDVLRESKKGDHIPSTVTTAAGASVPATPTAINANAADNNSFKSTSQLLVEKTHAIHSARGTGPIPGLTGGGTSNASTSNTDVSTTSSSISTSDVEKVRGAVTKTSGNISTKVTSGNLADNASMQPRALGRTDNGSAPGGIGVGIGTLPVAVIDKQATGNSVHRSSSTISTTSSPRVSAAATPVTAPAAAPALAPTHAAPAHAASAPAAVAAVPVAIASPAVAPIRASATPTPASTTTHVAAPIVAALAPIPAAPAHAANASHAPAVAAVAPTHAAAPAHAASASPAVAALAPTHAAAPAHAASASPAVAAVAPTHAAAPSHAANASHAPAVAAVAPTHAAAPAHAANASHAVAAVAPTHAAAPAHAANASHAPAVAAVAPTPHAYPAPALNTPANAPATATTAPVTATTTTRVAHTHVASVPATAPDAAHATTIASGSFISSEAASSAARFDIGSSFAGGAGANTNAPATANKPIITSGIDDLD